MFWTRPDVSSSNDSAPLFFNRMNLGMRKKRLPEASHVERWKGISAHKKRDTICRLYFPLFELHDCRHLRYLKKLIINAERIMIEKWWKTDHCNSSLSTKSRVNGYTRLESWIDYLSKFQTVITVLARMFGCPNKSPGALCSFCESLKEQVVGITNCNF